MRSANIDLVRGSSPILGLSVPSNFRFEMPRKRMRCVFFENVHMRNTSLLKTLPTVLIQDKSHNQPRPSRPDPIRDFFVYLFFMNEPLRLSIRLNGLLSGIIRLFSLPGSRRVLLYTEDRRVHYFLREK